MSTVCLALALSSPASAEPGLPAPVTDADFRPVDAALAEIGRDLFFDPILSGNRNISCATCHHPDHGTSDGLSLGIGEGGIGLGPSRHADPDNPPEQRIGRNSPALFNLGAGEFTRLFHDGRLEADPARPSGLRTPLEDEMVSGFDSALAAQTMFPVLSQDEMAGHYSENAVAQAVRQGLITAQNGAWDLLAGRVREIDAYASAFAAALPQISDGRALGFTDIANAIAAYVETAFRADDSPFDRNLRGTVALTGPALAGMELFYGEAGCATCHAGPFQTDHAFHAVAMPQLGPGKAARFERHQRDTGRMRVTGKAEDAYRFRTPSLRNVALTAPYGHAGAYGDLRDAVTHMADPISALTAWKPAMAVLPPLASGPEDFAVRADAEEWAAIAVANEAPRVDLTEGEIDALVAFLHALTDESFRHRAPGFPATVPSGLAVEPVSGPDAQPALVE